MGGVAASTGAPLGRCRESRNLRLRGQGVSVRPPGSALAGLLATDLCACNQVGVLVEGARRWLSG
jgi:hypothetical protein